MCPIYWFHVFSFLTPRPLPFTHTLTNSFIPTPTVRMLHSSQFRHKHLSRLFCSLARFYRPHMPLRPRPRVSGSPTTPCATPIFPNQRLSCLTVLFVLVLHYIRFSLTSPVVKFFIRNLDRTKHSTYTIFFNQLYNHYLQYSTVHPAFWPECSHFSIVLCFFFSVLIFPCQYPFHHIQFTTFYYSTVRSCSPASAIRLSVSLSDRRV